jgi:hypothetical protein
VSIDLDRLAERHPALPRPLAKNLGFLAALALQRRHRPGVLLKADLCGQRAGCELVWRLVPEKDGQQVDTRRATEDGAEAIALGLVHEARRWVVHRRLQRRQYGDWLVEEQASGRKVVLEVGGLDEGSLAAKLNGEVAQVARSPLPFDRAACVVRFTDVSAILVEVPHAAG